MSATPIHRSAAGSKLFHRAESLVSLWPALSAYGKQNAVEHGSRADGKETIFVRIHMEAAAVEMEVEDPGTGEDPQTALERDVEKPVAMDEPRGRGLFLIYRLAGVLERRIASGGGLHIRARKEAQTS